MSEYFKFWLAKELAPFVIMAGIAVLFGLFFVGAVVYDKVNRWRANDRQR